MSLHLFLLAGRSNAQAGVLSKRQGGHQHLSTVSPGEGELLLLATQAETLIFTLVHLRLSTDS